MERGRREFIAKSFFGLLALIGLGFLVPAVKVLAPRGGRGTELAFFPLMTEDEIPRIGVKKAELVFTVSGRERKTRLFLVSSPGGLALLSATCSHLGCLVNYHQDRREFVCPCHGGRYDLTGKNIAGPPPSPLTQLPLKIQDGMLLVGMRI